MFLKTDNDFLKSHKIISKHNRFRCRKRRKYWKWSWGRAQTTEHRRFLFGSDFASWLLSCA